MKLRFSGKYLAVVILFVFTLQFTASISTIRETTSYHPELNILVCTPDSEELLTDNLKFNRNSIDRKFEYKLVYDENLHNSEKGNSVFYFYNQLLPKNLSSKKIAASFFTFYFSTAV